MFVLIFLQIKPHGNMRFIIIFYITNNIPNTTANTTNTIPNIIVHFFNFPSLVLPLFFSKKLFVVEPVIVADAPCVFFCLYCC